MPLPVSAESPLIPVWSLSKGLAIREGVLIDSGTAALTSNVASAGFKFLGPGPLCAELIPRASWSQNEWQPFPNLGEEAMKRL